MTPNMNTNTQNKVSALKLADYLLYKGQAEGVEITPKKLQKLLYYVQAWSAAINDKKVFEDRIEAWIHGPAIKEVYAAFQQFGGKPILKEVAESAINEIPQEVRDFVDKVWSVYSGFDGNYLEYLTHSEDPWKDARKGIEPYISSDNEITYESMRSFYGAKLQRAS
jgi:uncharacterized phage-associated protein